MLDATASNSMSWMETLFLTSRKCHTLLEVNECPLVVAELYEHTANHLANSSWPSFGPDTIRWCRGYTSLPFETQLMVSEKCTDAMLPQFTEVTKGPNGEPGVVIVHVEACTHLHRALSNIRAEGGSPSVALNPHTPAEMIENVLDLVDHVLVMTVNPGFGGQAYIPTMTDKIEKIRKWIVDRDLDVDIEVDGGIKATKETIGACAAAGANCFIAGSGLFAYDDMAQGVKELTALALEGQGVE